MRLGVQNGRRRRIVGLATALLMTAAVLSVGLTGGCKAEKPASSSVKDSSSALDGAEIILTGELSREVAQSWFDDKGRSGVATANPWLAEDTAMSLRADTPVKTYTTDNYDATRGVLEIEQDTGSFVVPLLNKSGGLEAGFVVRPGGESASGRQLSAIATDLAGGTVFGMQVVKSAILQRYPEASDFRLVVYDTGDWVGRIRTDPEYRIHRRRPLLIAETDSGQVGVFFIAARGPGADPKAVDMNPPVPEFGRVYPIEEIAKEYVFIPGR